MAKGGVEITGLAEALQAMKIIDPTVRKESLKPIQTVGRDIANKAKARIPQRPARNWGSWKPRPAQSDTRLGGPAVKLGRRKGFGENGTTYLSDTGRLGWDQATVRGGIKYLGGGQRMNIRLVNKTPQGVVFETAGRRGNYTTNQAPTLVRNLDRFGVAPRGLIKTWRDQNGMTRFAGAIKQATDIAEAKINEVVR